jgi:hypothetical protein
VANNLFVSYDLTSPGQNYDTLIQEIKKLGGWDKIHYSLWYVKSELSAEQARNRLVPKLDKNDRLMVIDTKNNLCAWQNIPEGVSEFITAKWLL